LLITQPRWKAAAFVLLPAAPLTALFWGTRDSRGAITLAVIGLLVWLIIQVREGRGRIDVRHTQVLVGIGLAAFVLNVGPKVPGAVTGESIRSWNQFHYYLGAKYHEEVGWDSLYEAVLYADDRWQERKAAATGDEKRAMARIPDFAHARSLRSMTTYFLGPREEALAAYDASVWTPERLEELGRDSRWLRRKARSKEWARRFLLDFGFNPAPPWTIVGTTVANAIPLGSPAYPLITSSDLVVHVLVILAMAWAFGPRAAALAALWIHTIPLNGRLVVGGFLNYDWLGASILGIAAYRKEKPVLAATALAYAGMTRVFPGVLILPVVGRWAWNVVKRRPTQPLRRTFSVVFIASCAVLFVASHFTGRGTHTWLDWEANISKHSQVHATSGARRVGLGRLVRHTPTPRKFWNAQRLKGAKLEAPYKAKKRIVLVLSLALLLFAIRKRTDHDAMLLMLFAVWLIAVSSRYYASIWVLLFTLPTLTPEGRRSWPGTIAGAFLLLMSVLFYLPKTSTGEYFFFNYEALAMFVAVCIAYILIDRREARVSPAT
jgi:hypothetical protein